MGLFDPGQATQTASPGALAPADIASRIFAIKLLLSRLMQTGGAPQTFGNYLKSGPRKFDTSQIGAAGGGLLEALSKPGAFQPGPSVVKSKPSSPSLFQDAAGLLPLLLMLNQAGTGKATGPTIMEQILMKKSGIDPSTVKEPEASPGLFSQMGSGMMSHGGNSIYDAIRGAFPGAPSSTAATSGATLDPSIYESQDLGMSIDPSISDALFSSLFSG